MQFYFPPELTYVKILEILKHWVLEYHVDGFQLMGMNIPMQLLCMEPLFAETKLISEKDCRFISSPENEINGSDSAFCNFGYMNDAFLYDIRKLLKGDSNMVDSLIYLCRKNAANKSIVNYIAKQDGFRLSDLVSYNSKHNEANGEDNQDGIADNYSWNCGIEGKTRKKAILDLRMRQMKNAMTFVILSQGTPLIYSGDEFGNSQDGNNNPYCQDNSICWIKWNMLKTNEELFGYTREMIALRKSHKILHLGTALRGIDYMSCGYPDISFHGREAWRPDTSADSRSLGILYCGRYGNLSCESGQTDDSYIYIGINMHWIPYTFGLPQMPKGLEWVKIFSTAYGKPPKADTAADSPKPQKVQAAKEVQEAQEAIQNIQIPPRTIMIYETVKSKNIDETANNKVGGPVNKTGNVRRKNKSSKKL